VTRRLAVVSLGCAKNLVDTEAAVGALASRGYRLTPDEGAADVVLVNTCAFIGPARDEARVVLAELSARAAPGAVLAVMGCYAQLAAAALRRDFPRVDAVVGVAGPAAVAAAVEAARKGKRTTTVGSPRPALARLASRPRLTARHVSFVKIADGCDHPCSFCVIPRLRGPFRSRPADAILREAEAARAGGAVELVLLAQDTSRYGEDRGVRDGLAKLLRRLGGVGVPWLRVLYLHPARVTDELLAAFADVKSVVKYFDLPLQHVAPRILAAMGRPAWTPNETMAFLDNIRGAVPGAALRTSFVVGFPGETRADFDGLLEFAAAARFDHLGAFEFSAEEGTPAAALPRRVAARVARERRAELMLAQQGVVAARYRDLRGARYRVLVDAVADDGWATGRTYFQAPEADAATRLAPGRRYRPGTFVAAEVVGHEGYELVAKPVAR